MKYDTSTRTFDCNPTLTDSQVLDFCINGYMMLEGVIPDSGYCRQSIYDSNKLGDINSYPVPSGFLKPSEPGKVCHLYTFDAPDPAQITLKRN